MQTAVELFENALTWLRDNYDSFHFFAERDIVWTLHLYLLRCIEEHRLPYTISYNYPMGKGALADLAILNEHGVVEVAAEFKYEPSHSRADIRTTQFPVVFWKGKGSVAADVERAGIFIADGKAGTAYAILIDEGRFFRGQAPHPDSVWIDWDTASGSSHGISVLWSRVGLND